eukprot:NODE_16_length_49026_cov_1.035992.p3 type:complete len:699 gc:universal NODE_16_length_49026_cov_1.035992:31146-33242(+)
MEGEFDEITNYIRTSSMKLKKKTRVKKLAQINMEEKILPDNVEYSQDGEYIYYSSTCTSYHKLESIKSILKTRAPLKEPLKTRILAKVLKKNNSGESKTDISKFDSSATLAELKKGKKVQFLLEMLPKVAEKEDEDQEEYGTIKMTPEKILQIYNQVCDNKNVQPIAIITEKLTANLTGPVKFDLSGINLSAFSIITVLSGILFYNFGLESLRTTGCCLNDERLSMILCSLESSGSIVNLDVSYNDLVSDVGIRRLCETVRKLKSIHSLDISGIPMKEQKTLNCLANCFKIQKIIAMSSNNSTFQGLQTLRLDAVELNTPFQLQSLAIGIRNSNIRYLSLRRNNIDEVGCFGLLRLFANYEYNAKVEKQYIKIIEKAAKDITRYRDVDLEEKLAKLSIVYLNEHEKGRNGLWVLDLSNNFIRHGAFMLFEQLKTDTTIRQLNLSHNLIESSSCEDIFESVTLNKTLEILDLSHNLIGGSEEDFSDLRKNEKTKRTEERDEFSRIIQKALMKNTKLKSLSLAYCKLHFNSLYAISEGIHHFYGLRVLDLRGNIFRFEALRALALEISNNKEITKIELSIAAIRSVSQSKLEEIFINIMSVCSSNLEAQLRQIGENIKICCSDEDISNVLNQASEQLRLLDLATELVIDSPETYKFGLDRFSELRYSLETYLKLLQLLPSMMNIEKFQCILDLYRRDICH